jgi:hypothetical protein
MVKSMSVSIVLVLALASSAWAGLILVPPGPVSGTWNAGDSVVVAGGAYVEAGSALRISHGVHVFFESTARFNVNGDLVVAGDMAQPVIFYCVSGWRGISIRNSAGWQEFTYVIISPAMGLARQALEVVDAAVQLTNCDFSAHKKCLQVVRGEIRARENTFQAYGVYSHAVELIDLQGLSSSDCGDSPGNFFHSNFIRSNVDPSEVEEPVDPFEMTAALWVDGSTNCCLTDNDIVVRAPRAVAGVRFGESPPSGDQSWNLERMLIFAQSLDDMAIGVVNEHDGELDVLKCTVVVNGHQDFSSSGFYAARTAYININSTATILGNPRDIFFSTSGSGRIDVNYLLKWIVSDELFDRPEDPDLDPFASIDNDPVPFNVSYGDSIWTENPLYEQDGVWGQWPNRASLLRFFALRPNSPCIDRGDPDRGIDPDQTRWDLGRTYFDQTGSPVEEPRAEIPVSASVLAAYPNPFNPTTRIPLELSRAGTVSVAVYDVLGRLAQEVVVTVSQPGLHTVQLDGSRLATGAYLAQVRFSGEVLGVQRLILTK